MQLFDSKWKRVLSENGIRTWEIMRYVDDARAILPPVKPGWRWSQGRLRFCKRWRMEDMEIPGERRTKEILGQSMQGVESYLKFTMESGEDFQGGWLPTLDTTLRVEEDNSIMYRYYEKETTTNQTVQKSSAMEENCKIQILANDLVRRLGNTRDDGGTKEVSRVVDGYGQKLLNSGFSLDQTKNIIVKGIKGYEGRKLRCVKEGRSYRRTANESRASRSRGKLLSKTSWYKSRKKEDLYERSKNGKRKKQWKGNEEV